MDATQRTIDEFIKTMILPEHRPIVDAFRKLIKKDFPQLKEEMRYYIQQAIDIDSKK